MPLRHSKIYYYLKKILFCVIIFAIVILTSIYNYGDNNDYKVKRVISFVCDDSFSMLENGQDYYYANYMLQNMVAMMNATDELNVVYLSDVNKNNMHNMSNIESRKNYITELKNYSRQTTKTDFAALETAVDYLKDKKSLYGNDNTYKYYLVVITDGNFDNYPSNFSKYLSDLRDNFVGSYFKGIFIGVGDKISANLKNSVLLNNDYHYISSNGNEDIIKAVFEAHDLIYNRTTLKEEELNYFNNNNSLWFNAPKNINRVIVLEQNQNAKVTEVLSGNTTMDNKIAFECDKMNYPILKSRVTHTEKDDGLLPKGRVDLYFDKPVDKSYGVTRVIVEYTDAESKDNTVKETTKNTEQTTESSSIPPVVNEESDTGTRELPNDQLDKTKEPKDEPVSEKKEDPVLPGPHISSVGHSCPCPPIKVLLVLFLISLLKAIHDKKVNRDNYNNNYKNPNNIDHTNVSYNQVAYNNYRKNEEYYNKRITIRSIIIALLVLLWMLCQLFWCRCNFITCWSKCWWAQGGCGCSTARCSMLTTMPVSTNEPIIIEPTEPTTPTEPTIPTEPTTLTEPTTMPTPDPPTPTPPLPKIPIVPFIVLGLLGGYLFKNRFDTKFHGFEKWDGKTKINDNNIININKVSKFIPYVPESGLGSDLSIKAAKKKDRVVVPKKFLTSDMKLEGEQIDINQDLILYEDMKPTNKVNGKEIIYIYKHYPGFEVDV